MSFPNSDIGYYFFYLLDMISIMTKNILVCKEGNLQGDIEVLYWEYTQTTRIIFNFTLSKMFMTGN
jgi:hypothetical protein